jgi:hypothetical protein
MEKLFDWCSVNNIGGCVTLMFSILTYMTYPTEQIIMSYIYSHSQQRDWDISYRDMSTGLITVQKKLRMFAPTNAPQFSLLNYAEVLHQCSEQIEVTRCKIQSIWWIGKILPVKLIQELYCEVGCLGWELSFRMSPILWRIHWQEVVVHLEGWANTCYEMLTKGFGFELIVGKIYTEENGTWDLAHWM